MKTIEIAAFTIGGSKLGLKLKEHLLGLEYNCRLRASSRTANELKLEPFNDIKSWTSENFSESDALIFIGACGIAVRAIAPYAKDKFSDPAVIVIDESAKYVIPILSGHIGGGNSLASKIADIIGAEAVISTATDITGQFAVDIWANKSNLFISSREAAKRISAELVAGRKVSFSSDFPVEGKLPNNVTDDKCDAGFYVTLNTNKKPYNTTLLLYPKVISLGIGCRKGTPYEDIRLAITKTLNDYNISEHAVCEVHSIDLKKNEDGIIKYCENKNIPFKTFSASFLQELKGDFTASDFVKNVTGIDNVCERSAVAEGGKLFIKKLKYSGITVAAAKREYTVSFD